MEAQPRDLRPRRARRRRCGEVRDRLAVERVHHDDRVRLEEHVVAAHDVRVGQLDQQPALVDQRLRPRARRRGGPAAASWPRTSRRARRRTPRRCPARACELRCSITTETGRELPHAATARRTTGRRPAFLVVDGAHRGRDGKTRRHGQLRVGHLGEAGALATEQVLHGFDHHRLCHRRRNKCTLPGLASLATFSSFSLGAPPPRGVGFFTGRTFFAIRLFTPFPKQFRRCPQYARFAVQGASSGAGVPCARRRHLPSQKFR